MATTVEITTHLEVILGAEGSAAGYVVKELGSKTVPVSYDITNGHVHEVRAQCDDDYLDEVLWTTGDGNFDTFELLWFVSDADVFLELRNTQATDEFILIEIKADVPLILTSDDIAGYDTATRFDDAALIEATDWDQCDQITVQRNVADAAGDATVHLALFN